jgi:HAMP domain-containing protein
MLRIRLVLWYSLLVLLTLVSTGVIVYLLLYSSLTTELDNSLAQDARTTLRILSNRPNHADSVTLKKGARSKTIRELIDESLENAPADLSGEDYTDRVMSLVMDEMLFELSDSVGSSSEQIEGVLRRTLTGRQNYLIEVYKLRDGRFEQLYRSSNLNNDTLRSLFFIRALTTEDSLRHLGEIEIRDEAVRAVLASSSDYAIIVGGSEQDIHELIEQLFFLYLYIVPLVLIIATVGGVILARKALKPIEDIADTATEISAKNLSRRIDMPSRQDKELTTLVETLNTMFGRLEVSYHKIAQFSSDASHELKTPLAILKGEIEVANRRLESAGTLTIIEAKDLLESMMEEVERMQRIVEGLLLIAKAEDHRLPFEKESTSIY